MVVSVRDVAAAASVSVGTVSTVLNRPTKVAPSTVERVMQAIEELGFVRNSHRVATGDLGTRTEHRDHAFVRVTWSRRGGSRAANARAR